MDCMPEIGTRVLVLPNDDSKPLLRGVVDSVSDDGQEGWVKVSLGGRLVGVRASELLLVD